MNEQDLRAMVRESIARHRDGESAAGPDSVRPLRDAPSYAAVYTNAAFARLPLVRGGDDDGMCLIEPAVRCNHCGYCQSYGH